MADLLDVSVLVALFDNAHRAHDAISDWFLDHSPQGWASCAITENGFARVVSQPTYPAPSTVRAAVAKLALARSHGCHEFWPCHLSLADPAAIASERLLGPGQITDVYLLALAVAHNGRFVTLDRRIALDAVPGATAANLLVLRAPDLGQDFADCVAQFHHPSRP